MEEHTVFAKKLLYRLIYGVVTVQILLLFVDKFPIGLSALSVVSHGIYAQNLRRFPVVKLTDPLFLLSCGMLLSAKSRIHSSAKTQFSSRNSQSLPLVPPLQCTASPFLQLIPLQPRPQHSYIHRDCSFLRTLCLACPLRLVRLLVGRRKRSAIDGLRVCDWRW